MAYILNAALDDGRGWALIVLGLIWLAFLMNVYLRSGGLQFPVKALSLIGLCGLGLTKLAVIMLAKQEPVLDALVALGFIALSVSLCFLLSKGRTLGVPVFVAFVAGSSIAAMPHIIRTMESGASVSPGSSFDSGWPFVLGTGLLTAVIGGLLAVLLFGFSDSLPHFKGLRPILGVLHGAVIVAVWHIGDHFAYWRGGSEVIAWGYPVWPGYPPDALLELYIGAMTFSMVIFWVTTLFEENREATEGVSGDNGRAEEQ